MKSVFISSTQRDLAEYRDAVKAAIERLDLRAIDMRNFGSQPGGAVNTSVREVRKGDIYVGILAQRYGYVPDGMTKSVTEQEYDEAVRLRMPRLMYLLDDKFPWDAERIEADPAAQAKLQAFKGRVNANEVRSLFTTPDDLAKQVTADLVKLLDKGQKQTFIARIMMSFIIASTLIILALVANIGGIRDQLTNVIGSMIPTPESTPFAQGVIGVVLANFMSDQPSTDNFSDTLAEAFGQNGIPFIRLQQSLTGSEFTDQANRASTIANFYNASIVIWGNSYENTPQVSYYFATPRTRITPTSNILSQSNNDPFSSIVSLDQVGVLYIVNFTQGERLYFSGNYAAALDYFDKAVQGIPKGANAQVSRAQLFFYRGNIFYNLDRTNEALADYTNALKIDPNYAKVYAARGELYYILGMYENSIADFHAYERLSGGMDLSIRQQIAQMQLSLTLTPTITETTLP